MCRMSEFRTSMRSETSAHRLLGVTEVRVETGGGQAPEATISVLHETVFEEMRRRIFEGRAALSGAGVAEPVGVGA